MVDFGQMITIGGDAELELVDSLDPFAEGSVFWETKKEDLLTFTTYPSRCCL